MVAELRRARYGYLLALHRLLLRAAGRSPSEIAAVLFCSRSSVYRIVKAYRAGALTMVDKTEERFYEAELYRLKGELTLQSPVSNPKSQVEEVEACSLKAIEIARRQSAKSLELRAVMSLSRLWQQQGKKAEARQMLTEIYGWFTEGFDTADLKDAKALLEELSA